MPAELFDPESLSAYPTGPGVYLMKADGGEIVYVGKAANLRARLRNYFTKSGDSRPSVDFLRRQVVSVETVATPTEKDAFLLENTLIKKHQPRYNIRLRDDKTYISLRFRMGHRFPRLEQVRVRGTNMNRAARTAAAPARATAVAKPGRRDDDLYFGPYSSASGVRETLRFLLRVFPVRTCKDSVFANRTRPCILFDVGKCCGPCTEPVEPAAYGRLVEQVARFLRGKDDEVRRTLLGRMEECSEAMEFEKAALLRDRLAALDATLERQSAVAHKGLDRDVVAVASERGRSCVTLHEYRGGTLQNAYEYYVKNYEQDDAEILYTFIAQHYDADGPHREPPPEILTANVEPMDRELLEEVLRERRGAAVSISVPQRGDRAGAARTAHVNARQALSRRLAGERTEEETLTEVQRRLGLPRLPTAIECVDISNIMGAMAVGSLVRFENAVAAKDGYRLYRIRTVEGSNDFAMMKEVLGRRFAPDSTSARPHPDLLMVDGGKGQMGVAAEVLAELGLTDSVMLCSIAKSRLKVRTALPLAKGARGGEGESSGPAGSADVVRFRTEERIFLPGRTNPVTFARNSPALHLLERIRDETHRTAIGYHRTVRDKANRRSLLDEIPGVGPKRKRLLLRAFGSLSAVKAATVDELAAVDGFGRDSAEALHRFLRDEGNAVPDDDVTEEGTADAALDSALDDPTGDGAE